jgi:hypothetical protein
MHYPPLPLLYVVQAFVSPIKIERVVHTLRDGELVFPSAIGFFIVNNEM